MELLTVKDLKEQLENVPDNTQIIITVCDSSRSKYMSALMESIRYNKVYGYITLSCVKEERNG